MGAQRKIKRRKASDIYKTQNRLLHKAFCKQGYPYSENKFIWLPLIREAAKRGNGEPEIQGLSDMTLGERHKVITLLQRKYKMKLFAPGVPVKIRDWKKGAPDVEYEFREAEDPQIRMVYAIWNEMGYRPKTLRGLCFKLFKLDDPRWLNDRQLIKLVNVVKARADKKGCGNYYRRGVA